ncbi:MAG: endolytic transglycosylase MltG [Bacteroidales bacterium]|nr:endolytic transglycosylase MltG [Bacteroidales bacterium]
MNNKRVIIIAVCAFLAFVLTISGVILGHKIYDRKISNFYADKTILVKAGTTTEQIEKELSDVVRRKESLHRELSEIDTLIEGSYKVSKTSSSAYLARSVSHGWQTPVTLVINGNIRTKSELAHVISRQLRAEYTPLLEAMNNDEFLSKFGVDSRTFFTIVIPDSYQIYWTASIEEIFSMLKGYADAFWNERRLARASEVRLTPSEVYTLASIVAMETHLKDEYPLVACVYENRLRKGMKLQACPTICFIYNYEIKRVLKSQLKTKSPYNTYINKGLPPGPISIPPKACIDAVLYPAEENYLYFSADPSLNGRNRFTTSFTEHIHFSNEYKQRLDTAATGESSGTSGN